MLISRRIPGGTRANNALPNSGEPGINIMDKDPYTVQLIFPSEFRIHHLVKLDTPFAQLVSPTIWSIWLLIVALRMKESAE